MHKIFLFQQGLFEEIILNQYKAFNRRELSTLLEGCCGFKLKNDFSLKNCLDKGLDKKTALILSCAYELGKRVT